MVVDWPGRVDVRRHHTRTSIVGDYTTELVGQVSLRPNDDDAGAALFTTWQELSLAVLRHHYGSADPHARSHTGRPDRSRVLRRPSVLTSSNDALVTPLVSMVSRDLCVAAVWDRSPSRFRVARSGALFLVAQTGRKPLIIPAIGGARTPTVRTCSPRLARGVCKSPYECAGAYFRARGRAKNKAVTGGQQAKPLTRRAPSTRRVMSQLLSADNQA